MLIIKPIFGNQNFYMIQLNWFTKLIWPFSSWIWIIYRVFSSQQIFVIILKVLELIECL